MSVSVVALSAAWAQNAPMREPAPETLNAPAAIVAPEPTTAPAPAPMPAARTEAAAPPAPAPITRSQPTPPPAPRPMASTTTNCSNPNGFDSFRTATINTAEGPAFGSEKNRQFDFLRDGEVVLTFDDGPKRPSTLTVLKILADYCIKATFFPIGFNAIYEPGILKQVAAAGHTIGSHTWTHQILNKTKGSRPIGNGKRETRDFVPKDEIEMGISAVSMALGGSGEASFFRFPGLVDPPELKQYLRERNIATVSADIDSNDYVSKLYHKKPEKLVADVMAKLKKYGKGILLMHDIHQVTVDALPDLLAQLKANGYKIVHMRAKTPVTALSQYDAMVLKDQQLPTLSNRPLSSVVTFDDE
jgi:peptidoglycan/xylan/chitin deacetylase (PgdA/CDA1 family)